VSFKNYIFIFFCLIVTKSFGQLDNSDKSSKKGSRVNLLAVPTMTVKKPVDLDKMNDDGFKTAYTEEQKKLAKLKKEKELEDKGILNKAKVAEERFMNSHRLLNMSYPVIDQDLGSFRVSSESVKIICRDFQYPDGDRVSVLVNDIPVIKNITLQRAFQGFDLPLEKGINRISFVALNQGTSGPNTASFRVYDDKGNLISTNEWYLATSAKATILIAKED